MSCGRYEYATRNAIGAFGSRARIIHEKWRSDDLFVETKDFVTRAEFVFLAALLSEQLVRSESEF